MIRYVAILSAVSALYVAPAAAVTLSYGDFSSTAGLQLNGNTAKATDASNRAVLRLTPASYDQSGSAFSTSAITLSSNYSFSTAFTFNINNAGGLGGGADGLVFAVQTNANTAGGGGFGIGYAGLPNSLGVEFDTFNNGGGDPNDNHVAVDLEGNVGHSGPGAGSAPVTSPFNLKGSTDLTAFIDYDGTSQLLQVRLSDTGARPTDALLSYSVDLASVLSSPNAFVGFTSGTGSGYANHDIVNWQFNDSFSPIGTSAAPEPATWAMLVSGFGLVGGSIRRRRAVLTAA